MQKDNRAKPNGDRRIHPTNDDQTYRDTESPSPTPHIQPLSASPIPDAAQRGAGPRRHSINSVGSAHSDSSKDDTRSPGIPPFAIGKRKASINSIGSDDQSDSERRSSHFSQKLRSRSIASLKPLSVTKKQPLVLSTNFKVPAILLLSNKLFNGIYVTSKMMFIMSVLSVLMCVIENEIWFSVYMAEENAAVEEASVLVLSDSQVFRSNMCKLVLSCCTALLGYYITVYYKQLLELKRLRQSEVDTFLNDQSTFRKSGLMGWYFLEMLVCLVHIPYGMDFDIIIEFRSIKAFYRGEMIVTLFIFLRLYHVVRVLRDWTLIRFKNAMFLSKLVHVEQDTAYALKVLLHENPVAFVVGGLLSTLILFGYLLRTYDTTARPLKEGFGLSQAYWISLLSLTTVGYGDDVPKSHLGRIMVVLLVYIGSILIPLQIAIVERLLQFNMQEERMIRVYRLEQKRHSFQKAAVSLVVAWYRSLKTKKTENIGGYIQTWKKFRMSHASSMAHIPTGDHNKADNNLSSVAGSLITSVNDLAISVSRQATESHDLSRRCNKNMQAMQSIADRLAMLLRDGDTAESIAAKINGSQSHQTSKSNQQASQESPLHPVANASNLNQETRQQRFARTNQTADHFDNAESVQDKHSSLSSDHQPQRHAVDQENPTENFQPGQSSGSQILQLAVPRKSSLESHSSLGHEIDTQAPQEQMSSQLQGLIHQRAQAQSSQFQQQPATETVSSALPRAGDYGYSSTRAVSQMPGDDHGQEYMQSAQRTPLQQQQIHPSSHHPTYHNQSPDLAFSRSAAAPGFIENHVSPEGFYPPPHSYSPEAIQFHRDRIYEQARPSLNSILRSSPGLIPTSDAVRMRPATYFSSKSPPVPLLTRPNSPGPKGFTPVRVKPFNPQGVISSLQGSAPAGSSSAYAKFLLARSEYKPESTQHSP